MSLFPRHIGRGGTVILHLHLTREAGPPAPARAVMRLLAPDGTQAAEEQEDVLLPPGPTEIDRYRSITLASDAALGRWDAVMDLRVAGRSLGSATHPTDHIFVEHLEALATPSGGAVRNPGPLPVAARLNAPDEALTLEPGEVRPLSFDDAASVRTLTYADGRVVLVGADGGPCLMRAADRPAEALAGLTGSTAALWAALAQPRALHAMAATFGAESVRTLADSGLGVIQDCDLAPEDWTSV